MLVTTHLPCTLWGHLRYPVAVQRYPLISINSFGTFGRWKIIAKNHKKLLLLFLHQHTVRVILKRSNTADRSG